MRWIVRTAGVAAVALALCCGSGVSQNARNVRQYYSKTWSYNKSAGYHYRVFHFKVQKTDTEYKQQYVIYKPAVTRHFVHWYNPTTKKYWARCPTVHHDEYGKEVKKGKDYWSLLPDGKKKESLTEIKETDYGAIKQEAPYLPGTAATDTDKEHIQCPPPDLPKD